MWWGPDRAEATHLSLQEVINYGAESRTLAAVAGYQEYDANLTGGQDPERVRGGSATPNLFDVLGVPGLALGMAGAVVLTRTPAGLIYGVGALDPLTFTAVPALLCVVALIACVLPARRAASLDPIATLRQG